MVATQTFLIFFFITTTWGDVIQFYEYFSDGFETTNQYTISKATGLLALRENNA